MAKANELPNDKLVQAYVALRDQRAKRTATFKADDEADKRKQDKIEAILLDRFNKDGLESVRTAAGTAYKAPQMYVNVADWDSIIGFIKETEAWEFLEHRVSKTAVEQYFAEHNDYPPGLNIRRETVINVRRSS